MSSPCGEEDRVTGPLGDRERDPVRPVASAYGGACGEGERVNPSEAPPRVSADLASLPPSPSASRAPPAPRSRRDSPRTSESGAWRSRGRCPPACAGAPCVAHECARGPAGPGSPAGPPPGPARPTPRMQAAAAAIATSCHNGTTHGGGRWVRARNARDSGAAEGGREQHLARPGAAGGCGTAAAAADGGMARSDPRPPWDAGPRLLAPRAVSPPPAAAATICLCQITTGTIRGPSPPRAPPQCGCPRDPIVAR